MKDNFLLKKTQQNVFDELSNEDAGKLIKGIFQYANTGDSGLDGYLKIIFIPIKTEIDKNEQNYKKRCETNKNNGSKGGAPKGNTNAQKTKTTEINQPVKKTTENNMNNHNHLSYITNHKEEKEDKKGVIGEKEGEKEEKKKEKIHFAEFVTMTNAEYEKLVSTHGKEFANQCIETLDNYKGSKGKKYASDYRAILSWVVDSIKEKQTKTTTNKKNIADQKEIVPEWFNKTNEELEEKISDERRREIEAIKNGTYRA